MLAALPEQTGDFQVSPTAFIILFGIGFAVGTLGHIFRVRLLVGLGVTLVMLATVLLPLALALTR